MNIFRPETSEDEMAQTFGCIVLVVLGFFAALAFLVWWIVT